MNVIQKLISIGGFHGLFILNNTVLLLAFDIAAAAVVVVVDVVVVVVVDVDVANAHVVSVAFANY